MSQHSFTVDEDQAGQRLDVYLSTRLDNSRSQIRKWIDQGLVWVEDETRKAGYRLRPGETVEVEVPPEPPSGLQPEEIPLEIIDEDDHIVVVDKPAGMIVHPGAGNPGGTLANALLYHFQQVSRSNTARPGIIHRLDKDTSGLLVVAKTDRAHDIIGRQFAERSVEKKYLALVYGHLDKRKGEIDEPIGRDPNVPVRMSTRSRQSRQALTRFEVLEYLERFTYAAVFPKTGRTHQIRVHFQHLNHPVVGDDTYARGRWKNLDRPAHRSAISKLGRHFLHATFLSFRHPHSGKPVSFRSDLPHDLAEVLETLKK